MCGIGGFSLSAGSKVNARKLSHALLTGLEKRGNQASGYAFQADNGSGFYKQDTSGSNLSLKAMPKHASSVILHTRLATHGSIRDNRNNHPVQSPDSSISLVHNGVIYNHDLVRSHLDASKKLPDVDTAVIPAILQQFSSPDKFSMLDGDAAVAWLDSNNTGVLNVARISHSPLTVAQLADGSFVFASTESILTTALESIGLKYNFIMDVKERTLLAVRAGRIDEMSSLPDLDPEFEQKMSAYEYKSYRSATSGKASSFNNTAYGWDDPYTGTWNDYDEGFEEYLENFVLHEGFFYDYDGTYMGTYETLAEDYEKARYNRYWSDKNMCYTQEPDAFENFTPATEDEYQFNRSQTIGSRFSRRSYWD